MVRNNTWDGKGEMPEKSLEHPDYSPPKKGDPSNGENLDYDREDKDSL